MGVGNRIHGIVPPHILWALAEHSDKRLRDIGLRSLMLSVQLRERRQVVGPLAMARIPAGEERRTIYDAERRTSLPGKLVRGEKDPPSRDQAVNEAYDGLGAAYDLLHDVFNRNSLDDRGMRLDATVHYDRDFDNAYWDGRQMVFGDGDGVVFVGFTRALEVIAHELAHGMIQCVCDLQYHCQSGALNESIADVFGCIAKQHHRKERIDEADWLIGEGILAPGIKGHALRSLKEPGTAYDDPRLGGKDPQPAHMDDFVDWPDTPEKDWGGVHINSSIPSRAFYLLCEQLGGYAWEDPGHIWYAGLRQLWPTATFQDWANVTHQVAGTLFGANSKPQEAVQAAWSDVGLPIKMGTMGRRTSRRRPERAGTAEFEGRDLEHKLQEVHEKIHELEEAIR